MKTTTALCVAVLLAAVGCKKEKGGDLPPGAAGQGSGGTETDKKIAAEMKQAGEDQLMRKKINGLIRYCVNSFARSVTSGRAYYLGYVGEDGPAGRRCKRYKYGPHSISEPASCARAVTKALSSPPKLPELEKDAVNFLAALRALRPLVARARRYYSQGDYKDDNCALGQTMHVKLMKGYELFLAAKKGLLAKTAKITDGITRRDMSRVLRRYGKGLRYYKFKVMLDAKTIFNNLKREWRVILDRGIRAGNLDVITAEVKRFQASVNAMDVVSQRMAALAKKTIWFSSFKSRAFDYLKACKEMMRRVRSKKRFTRYERKRLRSSSGWSTTGSFNRVVYQYNQLVRASNSVRFRR